MGVCVSTDTFGLWSRHSSKKGDDDDDDNDNNNKLRQDQGRRKVDKGFAINSIGDNKG